VLAPQGITAICEDTWFSHAVHSQGQCSWHGGIGVLVQSDDAGRGDWAPSTRYAAVWPNLSAVASSHQNVSIKPAAGLARPDHGLR
jgi:hypothetical protein